MQGVSPAQAQGRSQNATVIRFADASRNATPTQSHFPHLPLVIPELVENLGVAFVGEKKNKKPKKIVFLW